MSDTLIQLVIMVAPVLTPTAVLVGVDLVHFRIGLIVNVLIGAIGAIRSTLFVVLPSE